MTPDQTLIICRFLVDTCALLLWGAHGFLWQGTARSLAYRLSLRLTLLFRLAVVLLGLAAIGKLAVQAAILGNGWSDALDLSLITALITETRSGLALMVQAVLACLLLLIWHAFPKRRVATTTLLSGLFLVSLSISGHAAMNGGTLGLLHQINDGIHLLAAGAWVGALVPVLLLLRTKDQANDWHDSIAALMRFSTLGHAAVAVTLVSGTINSRLIVGQFWLDRSVPFQWLLLIKISLVGAMVAIACLNRYGFVPRMAQNRAQALRLLRTCTTIEIALAIAVIGLVATFGTMAPVSM